MEKMDIVIRNYRKEDRKAVREISLESSIFNEYRHIFDDEILADLLTVYFTDYEPTSCFIAEKEECVIGYVLGTKDVQKMHRVFRGKIVKNLVKKIFHKGQFFQKNNLMIIKNLLYSYLKGEFNVPDLSREYPATLHVNIIPLFRGHNVGSLLVYHFLYFLRENNVQGIHFGVLSESAKRFFLKQDFEVLFSGKYTFLQYLKGDILPHYIMGKKW